MDGAQTKYAQLFRAEAGDIIVNKIWARNGSVAVVPPSLAGCFGSAEFPMFTPRPQLDSRWVLENAIDCRREPYHPIVEHLESPMLTLSRSTASKSREDRKSN